MKKRTLSVVLSLQMLASATAFAFQPGVTINAGTNQNCTIMEKYTQEHFSKNVQNNSIREKDANITSLFEKISELNADSQLHPENTLMNEAKIAQYDSELADLGVTEMDSEAVQDLTGNYSNTLSKYGFTCPSSTKNVKWWTRSESVTYNNVKYNVQLVFAQNLNGNSNIAFGKDTATTLYKDKHFSLPSINTLASIYVQKALGLVKIIGWTPYELLFPSNESKNATCDKHLLTYRGTQTVCFGYAAKASNPKEQDLALVTNSISVASTQTFAGYKDGKPYTKSHDYTFSKSSDTYGYTYYVAKAANTNSGFVAQSDCIEAIKMGIPDPNNLSQTKMTTVGNVPVPGFPTQITG